MAPAALGRLTGPEPAAVRLSLLDSLLEHHEREIHGILAARQNSFTGARRFLVPQVVLAARFGQGTEPCRFADLGTGLGVLPRQLNSRSMFERFAPDLQWPQGVPVFREVPLESRFGVDRGPLPDLSWVRTCYGASAYYSDLFRELLFVLSAPDVRDAEVDYAELDLLDSGDLSNFIECNQINSVNVGYVLYEMESFRRREVIEVLRGSLCPPGVIVVSEPKSDLTEQGCVVRLYDDAYPDGVSLCSVSDGHFRGSVALFEGFDDFCRRYEIAFVPDDRAA